MQRLLQQIDNKEILIEILNHAIDYLIGNQDEKHTLKLCNKCGLQSSPEDFVRSTKMLAECFQNCCSNNGTEAELLLEFADLSSDVQHLVWNIYESRRADIFQFLIRVHNSQEHPLVETFDWDLRYIMGDSIFPDHRELIVVVSLYCRQANGKQKTVEFQANSEKLDKLIAELEKAQQLLSN